MYTVSPAPTLTLGGACPRLPVGWECVRNNWRHVGLQKYLLCFLFLKFTPGIQVLFISKVHGPTTQNGQPTVCLFNQQVLQ